MAFLEELRELSRMSLVISFLLGFLITFMNGIEVVAVLLYIKDTSYVPYLVYLSIISVACLVMDTMVILAVYAACCWRPKPRGLDSSRPSQRVNPLHGSYEP